MEWLQENVGQLATIVGMLYALARVIVALTPTPKDDKAMADVSVLLKTIASIFGLDLKQGVEKKPPNASGGFVSGSALSLLVCLSISIMVALPGCITTDARANLVAGNKVFAGTVRMLTVAVKANEFNAEEVEQISTLVHQGEQALADWEAAIMRGEDPVSYTTLFNAVLDRLFAYEQQAKGI